MIRLLKNSFDWVMKVFGDIELKTIIYQLHSPLKGTGRDILKNTIPVSEERLSNYL